MTQGSNELVDFSMTFLTSTWYITNPYLKSKLITVTSKYCNSGMAIDEVVLSRLSLLVSGRVEEDGLVF